MNKKKYKYLEMALVWAAGSSIGKEIKGSWCEHFNFSFTFLNLPCWRPSWCSSMMMTLSSTTPPIRARQWEPFFHEHTQTVTCFRKDQTNFTSWSTSFPTPAIRQTLIGTPEACYMYNLSRCELQAWAYQMLRLELILNYLVTSIHCPLFFQEIGEGERSVHRLKKRNKRISSYS